ncbi:MAG TPA: hypothetical protein VD997_02440 [Phycisphaerales bacterium]|nr:hypothetical protein [Phycisphaerales bacterium]
MSAVNRATKGPRTRGPRKRQRVVTVAWAVSRDAASRVWPVEAGDGEVELRWVLEAGVSRVVLSDGAREVVIAEGSSAVVADEGLLHVEASAGEFGFAATLRAGRVLYARTDVLGRLGVEGGRYEVVR